jgi:hypothetical protein
MQLRCPGCPYVVCAGEQQRSARPVHFFVVRQQIGVVKHAVFCVCLHGCQELKSGLTRCVMIGYGLARHLFLGSMPSVCVLKPNTLIPTAKQEAQWATRQKKAQFDPWFGNCAEPWFVSTHARSLYHRCSADGTKTQLRALPGSGPEGGLTSGKSRPRQPGNTDSSTSCVS